MARTKDGKFEKGTSGNPNGMAPGTKNEKTLIWNEIGDWFAGPGLSAYKRNLNELLNSEDAYKKSEGMKRYEALLEYFKPKQRRTETDVKIEGNVPISINKKYTK